MRVFIGVAAAGAIGVVVWKLLWVLLLPLFATMLGVVITMLKVALIAGLIYVIYRLYRKYADEPA